ncbi:uncharacterized protein LOC122668374 [Telopea speciosissima]|uniref:uncharacterized protein LOC122668374 n=1 Tax=Telopea speciosissima TaxID=54955 RepID=UPI001CC64D2A|nr:uncharacterized protein LOC122668374 [Telopea speciosissima]
MAMMWKRSLIRMGNQTLRFQRWRSDFDVNTKHQSRKLVWVRFPDLPYEYWHPNILFSLAKALGNPIVLDRRTKEISMGFFARVLVDMEITDSRLSEILVERQHVGSSEYFRFKQSALYEDGMTHCGFYRRVGHSIKSCKDRMKADAILPQVRQEWHLKVRSNQPKEGETHGGSGEEVAAAGGDAAAIRAAREDAVAENTILASVNSVIQMHNLSHSANGGGMENSPDFSRVPES